MKRFKFVMDDRTEFLCLARDFQSACVLFDQAGLDPRLIWAVEESD